MIIHAIASKIAIPPLVTDVKILSNSPKPEMEIGPKITTAIPPPSIIKIHIAKRKTKIVEIKFLSPS